MKHSILNIICCRVWLVILVCTFSFNLCSALQVQGYIIKEDSDTVFGTVKLSPFQNGSILLNGFDVESLHYQVSFKGNADRNYRLYSPASIEGFGFIYMGDEYIYSSFLLEHNSIFKGDRERRRFLSLAYKGDINLFQNTVRINYPSGSNLNEQYMVYYEFFLQKGSKDLLKVETTKSIKTVRDLLRRFGVEEKFIEEVPERADFRDIKTILYKYDKWLALQTKSV